MFERFNNCTAGIAEFCYNKTSEIYKYAPPAYDIAIRTLRAATLSSPLLLSTMFLYTGSLPLILYGLSTTVFFGCVVVHTEIIPTIREWTMRKLTEDQSKKNVVLFCRTTSPDLMGAATSFSSEDVKALKKFSETHSIVLVKIKDIASLNMAIDDIIKRRCKITTLWINAHGGKNSIELGDEICNKESVKKINFSKLEKNANIILAACSVGKQSSENPNIAEWIQVYAGSTRKVFGPNADLPWNGTCCTIIDQGNRAKWSFKTGLGKDISATISHEQALSKVITSYVEDPKFNVLKLFSLLYKIKGKRKQVEHFYKNAKLKQKRQILNFLFLNLEIKDEKAMITLR